MNRLKEIEFIKKDLETACDLLREIAPSWLPAEIRMKRDLFLRRQSQKPFEYETAISAGANDET